MSDKLKKQEMEKKLKKLGEGWALNNDHLRKKFSLKDFKNALWLVNNIGEVSERMNHHPNISFTWGEVVVEIWTHEVGGLTDKDYDLAKKIDEIELK